MAIILGIIGFLSAALWCFVRFSNAARKGQKAAEEIKGLIRSHRHLRQIDKRLVENLSDPRDAAAILLLQTATYKGLLDAEAQDHMRGLMREGFECDEQTMAELLAFAKVALNEINDASNSLRKILKQVNEVCNTAEKEQLVEMMLAVGQFDGEPNDQQELIIRETKRHLLPR